MTLADAQARCPSLRSVPSQPHLDAEWLDAVLEDFTRFTPMIALDAPHGLMLDITGCAHLFGGEEGLSKAVVQRAHRGGLRLRWALASTAQAARALSRFGSGGLFTEQTQRAALRLLPVAALELPAREEEALRRAGLKRLADLDDRPRAPLAARFGKDFPARLARLLGDEDIRITPHRAPAPVYFDRIFFELIANPEDIEAVLAELVDQTAAHLTLSREGGRQFVASFYRVDGHVRHIGVQTGHPSRDRDSILRLFREKMAALSHPLDPGFGFDQVRLAVPWTEELADRQTRLSGPDDLDEALDQLIDRLTARLGPDAVLRFEACGSHMPERSARMRPAILPPREGQNDWPALDPDSPPLRPLQMFDPPQPVETLAEVPDGYPLRFRWRRVLHEVKRAEGPERIGGEWWRAPDQRTRDYYRIEDQNGRRFWIFRQGLYGETPEPRWYIHGLFA
nr:DNA polymerase Y family protein [uncultured Brevundimonas sp.]